MIERRGRRVSRKNSRLNGSPAGAGAGVNIVAVATSYDVPISFSKIFGVISVSRDYYGLLPIPPWTAS